MKNDISGIKLKRASFASACKNSNNLIVYGVPGSGKSYYISEYVKNVPNYNPDNVIRTVFHPDYTNADFIGQILPTISGDLVKYIFNPGPFTIALKKSLDNPDKPVFLIIEEINRGNASAIFGEIFQLLDRDSDGCSRYEIINVNICDYFETIGYELKTIKLPSNLAILASMNTSDQNVFTLDSAFKRRWDYKKIKNTFVNHPYASCLIPCVDRLCTWKHFVECVNRHMLKVNSYAMNEDKFLGVFYVEERLLVESGNIRTDGEGHQYPIVSKDNIELFAYKVLEYLWNDVGKLSREEWFVNDMTLDELIEDFVEKGLSVFVDGIFDD